MKKFIKLLTAAVALLACDNVKAQLLTSFSGTGTQIGVTNSYYVVPANGVGFPKVERLDAKSDLEGSRVMFYRASNPVTFSGTVASSSTVVSNLVGTTFAAADIAVIRYKATETYQRVVIDAATATNLTLNTATSSAIAAGDEIYKMTTNGFFYTGSVSNITTTPMYWGKQGSPILIDLNGTAAAQIRLIGGRYER